VPVFWCLPRSGHACHGDSTYLNELYASGPRRPASSTSTCGGLRRQLGQFAAPGSRTSKVRFADCVSADGGLFHQAPAHRQACPLCRARDPRTIANRSTPVALPTAVEPARRQVCARRSGASARWSVQSSADGLGRPARRALGSGQRVRRPARIQFAPVLNQGRSGTDRRRAGRRRTTSFGRGGAARGGNPTGLCGDNADAAVLATPDQPTTTTERPRSGNKSAKGPVGNRSRQQSRRAKATSQKTRTAGAVTLHGFPRSAGAIRPSASTQGGCLLTSAI